MSAETIQEFKSSITDRNAFLTELGGEVTRVRGDATGQDPQWLIQAVINLASKRGYTLSHDDVVNAMSNEELSEEDLAVISGGFCFT